MALRGPAQEHTVHGFVYSTYQMKSYRKEAVVNKKFGDYPNVVKAIEFLMADNGMMSKKGLAEIEVPLAWEPHCSYAEICAERLVDKQVKEVLDQSEIDHSMVDDTENALEVFTNGEQSVQELMLSKFRITGVDLQAVLNSVFEGELYEVVVEEPA